MERKKQSQLNSRPISCSQFEHMTKETQKKAANHFTQKHVELSFKHVKNT